MSYVPARLLANATLPFWPGKDAAAVNKMCPVHSDDPVDPTVTTVYEGRKIGFCCDDCLKKARRCRVVAIASTFSNGVCSLSAWPRWA